MNWERERVVITGGAGFIGSHLVDAVMQRGCQDLLVLDDLSRGHLENLPLIQSRRQRLTLLNLADSGRLDYMAEKFDGAIVFHLAARVTNIKENRGDHLGMLQDNLRINANVVEAARRSTPKLVELTSTVCVYPHDAPVPTREVDGFPFHPEDTNEGYGLAKAILEKQAEYLYNEHKIPVIVPRFANAFGPRDYYDASSHVAPALIRKAFEEDVVEIWGSGRQTRTLMDARDIAETLVRLAEEPCAHDAQPINLGWGDPISIVDLAYLILKLSGMERKPVKFDKGQPDGHSVRQFCCERLVSLIGPPPCRPVEDTLADMIAEFSAGRSHT